MPGKAFPPQAGAGGFAQCRGTRIAAPAAVSANTVDALTGDSVPSLTQALAIKYDLTAAMQAAGAGR